MWEGAHSELSWCWVWFIHQFLAQTESPLHAAAAWPDLKCHTRGAFTTSTDTRTFLKHSDALIALTTPGPSVAHLGITPVSPLSPALGTAGTFFFSVWWRKL